MSAERRATPARRPRGRTALGWALLIGVALAAAWLLDGAASPGPTTLSTRTTLAHPDDATCDTWSVLVGRGQARGATVSLFTDGVAVARACDAAPRTLLLEGSAARAAGAFAVVADADGSRFDGFVDGSVTLSVRGEVRVAFTNDLATADEDRNLHATLR